MISRDFLKAGNPATLFAAFLYFDMSCMVWVLLGPLGVAVAKSFHLSAAQKGFMVAVPVLAGALLRLVNGVLVDRIGPKRTGVMGQFLVLAGLLAAWLLGVHSYGQVLLLGVVLGVAGASFAVALPLASRWYPQSRQGLALGIVGAGNSGTALSALFAPSLAKALGWNAVLGLACIPLAATLAVYLLMAKDSAEQPAPKRLADYLAVLKVPDAWWLMLLYGVSFGGFVGLASSLTIYFNAEYGIDAVRAGLLTAACVFAGSFIRPVGGALADRHGGARTLKWIYALGALGLGVASFHLPSVWAAFAAILFAMLALGAGNGAVFQLAPQRFRQEIGVVTGLVGMMGGVGGFYLASTLGLSKQLAGTFQPGFLGFAALCLVALAAVSGLKARWRASWAVLGGPGALPVRV